MEIGEIGRGPLGHINNETAKAERWNERKKMKRKRWSEKDEAKKMK